MLSDSLSIAAFAAQYKPAPEMSMDAPWIQTLSAQGQPFSFFSPESYRILTWELMLIICPVRCSRIYGNKAEVRLITATCGQVSSLFFCTCDSMKIVPPNTRALNCSCVSDSLEKYTYQTTYIDLSSIDMGVISPRFFNSSAE